jgi:hypothetical protein
MNCTEIDFFSGKRVDSMTVRENRLYDATLKKFGILKDTTALVKEALKM